jgi:hypothetical protein
MIIPQLWCNNSKNAFSNEIYPYLLTTQKEAKAIKEKQKGEINLPFPAKKPQKAVKTKVAVEP